MQHRFVNAQINSYTDVSTSCEILVMIGAVTSDCKRPKFENLLRLGCKFDDHRSFGTLTF